MEQHYGHGSAVSTDGPDQPIRQIPLETVEHARLFASRCATYDDLRTRSPLLEHNPEELYRRTGHRLSGAEHAVYGVIRQARRLAFAGARVSHRELGDLIGRDPRTCRRAVATLKRLELVRVVPQFRDGGIATTIGYDRSQTRNCYALGRNGKEPRVLPGLGGAPPPRRSVTSFSDKSSDKIASLSDGRSELFQSSDSPSCLPSTTPPEPRGEVSTSSSDRRLTPPSMPASPGEQTQRLRNEKSKVRTSGLTAPLGDLAKYRATTRQDARGAHEAAEAGDAGGWARAIAEAL